MYALPDDFDTHVLTGCYLEMVCFGPRITKLDFARPQTSPGEKPYKVSFCVESSLTYFLNGISGYRDFSSPQSCAPLVGVLLQDVTALTRWGGAGIEISFGEAGTITIDADSDAEFESYSVYLPSGDVLVV
jgi:hypothetical protein